MRPLDKIGSLLTFSHTKEKFGIQANKKTTHKIEVWGNVEAKCVAPVFSGTFCISSRPLGLGFHNPFCSSGFPEEGVSFFRINFLCLGVRLPKPSKILLRSFRVPVFGGTFTRLEALALFFFIAVQIATFAVRIHRKYEVNWPEAEKWYEVSKTLGKTVAISFVILLLPVSKSCFWWDLFNIKFERAVKFHTWLSWFTCVVVLAHTATSFASFIISKQFVACMIPSEDCTGPKNDNDDPWLSSRLNLYGWIAIVFLLPIVITSLPWFRRNKFEWFYYTHFLFIPFMILIHLHYDSMIYYSAPGLAAYAMDKVLWLFSLRRPIKISSLSRPSPGYIRMVLSVEDGYEFDPGQWVQICVPAISILEWHPMSISSAPGDNTFTIDIKVLGDWTQRLDNLVAEFDPTNHISHFTVFVDGFHGSSHREMHGYLTHEAIMMFSGGIGITPLLSSLRSIVKEQQSGSDATFPCKKVVFVWAVRDEETLDLYRSELAKIQRLEEGRFDNEKAKCEIEVIIHVTRPSGKTVREPITDSNSSIGSTEGETRQAGPLMRNVMGYGHKLMLTVGSSGGFLLGLFIANIAYMKAEEKWNAESYFLLQLLLSVFLTVFVSFIALSSSWFRPLPIQPIKDDKNNIMSGKDESDDDIEEVTELQLNMGSRPNIPELMMDMKKWCQANSCSSVGVGVCGPETLVSAVLDSSNKTSSDGVAFVLDREMFEW